MRAKYPPRNFEPFKQLPKKPRLEPRNPNPNPKRTAPAVPRQNFRVPLKHLQSMGQRPETDTNSRPSQVVETDPLENEPILERRKLQALVSLYHQSRNFITREGLDEHIDSEFGHAERLTMTRSQPYASSGLISSLRERTTTPTYTTNPPLFTFDIDPKAGTTRNRGLQVARPQRLAGVMYGTDERGEPALEAVEEAIQRGGFTGGIPGRKGI